MVDFGSLNTLQLAELYFNETEALIDINFKNVEFNLIQIEVSKC